MQLKSIASVMLITLLSSALTSGQRSSNRNVSKDEQELIQAEKDWSDAYLKHDLATIDRLLADEYVGIDGRGIMTTKTDEIEEAKPPKPNAPAPPFTVLGESVTDFKVRVYGNMAIVNARVIEKVKSGDQEKEIQYRRTTAWVKRQAKWQCVSFHGSRILTPSQ